MTQIISSYSPNFSLFAAYRETAEGAWTIRVLQIYVIFTMGPKETRIIGVENLSFDGAVPHWHICGRPCMTLGMSKMAWGYHAADGRTHQLT
jgi:hypothetical protein